jgi:chorismate synthase
MEINLGNSTNNSGGTLGGITTGEDVYFKVAIKPVSTIGKNQDTYDYDSNKKILEAKGRHDPCVLPRAMPIIEAMAAIVTGDHCLMQASRKCVTDLIINKDKDNIENCNDYDNDYDIEYYNAYGI